MENLFDFIAVNPFLILICLVIAVGVYVKFYMPNPYEIKVDDSKRIFSRAKEELLADLMYRCSGLARNYRDDLSDEEYAQMLDALSQQNLKMQFGELPVNFNAPYEEFRIQMLDYLQEHDYIDYVLERRQEPAYADKGFRNMLFFSDEFNILYYRVATAGYLDSYCFDLNYSFGVDESIRNEKNFKAYQKRKAAKEKSKSRTEYAKIKHVRDRIVFKI